MKLKTRLFAGVSTLALVGGVVAFAIPSSATPVVTIAGNCVGTQALAKIKATTTSGGLDNTLAPVKIAIKSLATVSPVCSGIAAADGQPDLGSVKSTIGNGTTMEASCNTSLHGPIPPSGKLGWSTQATLFKEQGYVRLTGGDPAINYYADVVTVHGLMTKGSAAGFDVDGSLYQNPTLKDKSLVLTPGTWGQFGTAGVDTNAVDSLLLGTSCQLGAPAGTLLYNDNSGGKVVTPVPSFITETMVGDGPSLIEPLIPPANGGANGPCPCVTAQGLVFSAF